MIIDLVVPYVDMTNRDWYQTFKIANQKNGCQSETINTANRFRGQGEFFRFFFRCIEKNMPWINSIFLLVQNKSEVPSWLNKKEIKIVTHDQFIPKKFLPTYSSGTIECFLHKIPELSEYFIYANDDFFLINRVMPEDFFEKSYCKFNLKKEIISEKNSAYFKMCQYNYESLFGQQVDNSFLRLDHEFRPYLKSKFKECFDKYESLITDTITPFRNPKMIFCYFFSFYLDRLGLRLDSNLKNGYLGLKYASRFIGKNYENCHNLCLNDTDSIQNSYQNESLNNYFRTKFPEKSKYELTELKVASKSKNYLYF